MAWLWLALGLGILTIGAEILVRGASALALAMKISPLVVGLTIVAYGTSAPELVVSLQSTLSGQADIAIGNVVGSNIFNVLFILGISAMIIPLVVAQQLVWFDVPLMILLSLMVLIFGIDGRIGRVEGLVFSTGLVLYTAFAVMKGRKETRAVEAEYEKEFGQHQKQSGNVLLNVVLVAAGLGLLVLGARMFLDSSVQIARSLGISELVIGLTLVAAGTSLPEVATSIVAAIRGERDIAVGNVVGSNIFNIMGVLGLSASVSPTGLAIPETALVFDIPVMIAVAVACLPIFFTGHQIARWEGIVFFIYWCAYTGYLILASEYPQLQRTLGIVMVSGVIPLTAVGIIASTLQELKARKTPAQPGDSKP